MAMIINIIVINESWCRKVNSRSAPQLCWQAQVYGANQTTQKACLKLLCKTQICGKICDKQATLPTFQKFAEKFMWYLMPLLKSTNVSVILASQEWSQNDKNTFCSFCLCHYFDRKSSRNSWRRWPQREDLFPFQCSPIQKFSMCQYVNSFNGSKLK